MAGIDLLGDRATPTRRRGRPPGAKNKRSGQLGDYLAARYGDQSPALMLAAVALPTRAEMKQAKGDRIEAMALKAERISERLGLKMAEAWEMIGQAQRDLMPYLHQRLAQLDLTSKGEKMGAAVVVVEADAARLAAGGLAGGDLDVFDLDHSQYGIGEEDQPLSLPGLGQVAPLKSHD